MELMFELWSSMAITGKAVVLILILLSIYSYAVMVERGLALRWTRSHSSSFAEEAHVGDMGLLIGDRLAVFITGAREVVTQSAKVGSGNFQVAVDGRRHLQFTINTIVFALTQEGGVTQQLIARVK